MSFDERLEEIERRNRKSKPASAPVFSINEVRYLQQRIQKLEDENIKLRKELRSCARKFDAIVKFASKYQEEVEKNA